MAISEEFDSMSDFLDSIAARPRLWTTDSSESNDERFSGTKSFQQADEFARDGWPEGRELMARAAADAASIVKVNLIPARWNDVAGAYADIQAAIAGDPLCMVNIGDDDKVQRPVIDFWVEVGAASATKKESITARGAAMLAWIDALEDTGRRVALTVISRANNDGAQATNLTVKITIKRPDEPIDLDRLTYCLINPSMLRRHIFAWRERTNRGHQLDLYGISESLKSSEIPSNCMFFPRINHEHTPEQAAEAARKIIAAGGLIDDENA